VTRFLPPNSWRLSFDQGQHHHSGAGETSRGIFSQLLRVQSARESMLKGLEVQLKAAEAFLLLKAVPTVPGHFVGTATPKQHSSPSGPHSVVQIVFRIARALNLD